MSNRELLKKLNSLKSIGPDNEWKKNYRDILYSQISAGSTDNKSESNFKIIWENIAPVRILADLAKPVWAASLASVLILVIGVGGVYASKNSKPGDSLYIAKIISEKAQLAVTFNEKDKARLGLEFATNRAKEIAQVLEEGKGASGGKNEKVEQLSQNFKKEIKEVKSRLKAGDGEPQVFGANLGKNNQRMEVSEQAKPADKDGKAGTPEPLLKNQTDTNATSTAGNANQAGKMLEEAEKMFDEKNYNGSIDKLQQVNQIINQEDSSGQVKGASETASSTGNN